jgi:hypothetical protein
MAMINVKEMGEALVAGLNAALKRDGHSDIFDTSDLDAKDLKASVSGSRMKIEVFYNQGPDNMVRVESLDTKTGKQETIFCRYPVFSSRLVKALQDGNGKVVRAIKNMGDRGEFQDLLLEEWKRGRCLFEGVPNKTAMFLLSGLRREVPAPVVATRDGTAYKGGAVIQSIREASLMDLRATLKRKHVYATNLRGYEVLKAWAERNPVFDGYLNAFLPKDWEQTTKAKAALKAMHEGANAPLARTVYR